MLIDRLRVDAIGCVSLVKGTLQAPCRVGAVGKIEFFLVDKRGVSRMGLILGCTSTDGFSHSSIDIGIATLAKLLLGTCRIAVDGGGELVDEVGNVARIGRRVVLLASHHQGKAGLIDLVRQCNTNISLAQHGVVDAQSTCDEAVGKACIHNVCLVGCLSQLAQTYHLAILVDHGAIGIVLSCLTVKDVVAILFHKGFHTLHVVLLAGSLLQRIANQPHLLSVCRL